MNQTTQNQIENADFEIFNRKVSVSIDTGNVEIKKHGSPYIGLIKDTDPKFGLKREFIGEKITEKGMACVTLNGEFHVGTIFEDRKTGSRNSDNRYFNIVTRRGLSVREVNIDTKKKVADAIKDRQKLLEFVLQLEEEDDVQESEDILQELIWNLGRQLHAEDTRSEDEKASLHSFCERAREIIVKVNDN